jgi:NAD(P)-dependent dehydrogenase (short-subunit alcohol dehydrogenase family)
VRLEGKVAVVTGSTRGIGRAIAIRFAAEGAKVVVTGRTSEDGSDVVRTIRDQQGDAVFVRTDVTVEDDVRNAIAAATTEFGRLDVLVNNAGATDILRAGPNRRDGHLADIETDAWEAIFRGSTTSAFWACKYALAPMSAGGGGAVVSISTAAAGRAVAGITAHAASKAAVEALTRVVAVEGASHHVRANSIVVGFIVDSGGHEPVLDDPERLSALRSMHLTRLGRTEDIASAALFLASDEAGFVTGVSLPVDGGTSVRLAV